MSQITIDKVHAGGNDFLVHIDEENEHSLTSQQIRWLTDRHMGVGADGVIRAVRTAHVSDAKALLNEEPGAEWYFDAYDRNGVRIELCGNALRVLVHVLREKGIIEPERRDTVPIATPAGIRDVLIGVAGVTVDLGRWRLADDYLLNAPGLHISRPAQAIVVNDLNIVCALSDDQKLEALCLEEQPELAPLPDEPATVVYATPQDPFITDGVAHINIRVRGNASSQLLSSANGAASAALAFRHWGGGELPNSWAVHSPGGRLAVRMFATEEGEHVSVSGPVQSVFSLTVELPE